MMTKADFEAIAAALNESLWRDGNDPATVVRVSVVVGKACADRAKGEFDGKRWMQAVINGTHVPIGGAS